MLPAFCLLGALTAFPLCFLFEASGIALAALYVGLTLACAFALFFLYILGLFLFSLCIDKEKPGTKDHPFVRFLIAETVRMVCQIGRVKIRFEGKEKMPEGRFLLVSNHRSMFDPLISLVAMKKFPLAFVTKPENLKIPMVGSIIRYCCFLPIDRENPRNAIRTIGAAASLIKQDIISVGIYPEGTRNRGREEVLLPFHAGVLMIAQKANAPIVVVATQGTEFVTKNFPFRRSEVSLKVCKVIPAEQVVSARTSELSDKIREILTQELTSSPERT